MAAETRHIEMGRRLSWAALPSCWGHGRKGPWAGSRVREGAVRAPPGRIVRRASQSAFSVKVVLEHPAGQLPRRTAGPVIFRDSRGNCRAAEDREDQTTCAACAASAAGLRFPIWIVPHLLLPCPIACPEDWVNVGGI